MIIDLEAERWRAFLRMGLMAALVVSWSAYALRVPVSSGSMALKAALAKKAPAKAGTASVSWVNGGAPLDAASMAALQKEAETGVPGPAVNNYIEAARKRGDLDKAIAPNGMSYARILRRAEELADEVNARSHDLGGDPEERRPGDDDPAVVVPQLLELLRSPHPDTRSAGAMMMVDNRWAKSELAVTAVPALEGIVRNNEEGAGFAEIALKRIRFWEAKRRYAAEKR